MSIEALKRENAELKATNLELQNQIKRMETIFDSLSEGVVATNLEGEFLIANPSAQEIVGMAPVEGDPEEWSEVYGTFYPDKTTLVPSTELPLYKAMRGEATNDVRLVLRNKNRPEGVFVSVSGRPLYDEAGTLIGGVIVIRDIDQLEQVTRQLETTVSQLQRQNTLMDTVFNSIGDGVIVADKEGNFLLFNPLAEEIVGIGLTDEAPEEWSEIYGTFYPDKVTTFPSTELPLYKAIQGEITDDVEVFIRNKNRPEGVFVSVNGRSLYNETGDLIGGVVVFRDITHLKEVRGQLEATVNDLQTQNALMDAIFNSISDGIIVANKEGKYVLFNKTAREMAGQDLEDVHIPQASGKFGLFDPESGTPYPGDKLPLARALQGKYADNIEILIRNPQVPHGVDASISARPIYNSKGTVNGGVAVIRDISEHKASENQLAAMNAQLTVQSQLMESIFNSISDGVFVSDDTGRIIMANPRAMQMADLLKSVVEPDEWVEGYNFFYPDKVTPFPLEELPIMAAIRGETVDDVEVFVNNDKAPDGVYLNVSGRPLRDSEGEQSGGVVVFRDVTDKVKTEEALTQAFTQGRLEVVDTILHNIGNAINSVAVGIDTVHHQLINDRLTPRLSALAKTIEEHQDHLSHYITNDPQGQKIAPFIVTLAADFDAVKQELQQTVQRVRDRARHIVDIIRTQNSYQDTSGTRKDIRLADAISDAIKMLQDSIDRRHIHIQIDCAKAPQEIRIQESQFHQMLVNLIKNAVEAIDALEEKGQLHEEPRIKCRAYVEDDFLCLDITDNGIGIAPENINKIFSAGFTTKEEGNGLGLHSSANFVISAGGKIQALSEGIGKGTTVRIIFRHESIYRSAL